VAGGFFLLAVVAFVIGSAIAMLVIGDRLARYRRARRGPAAEPEPEPDDVW
jgi:hypothetical protein